MAPSATMKDKAVVALLHIKSTAIKVGLTQGSTNLEFLTNDKAALGAHQLQTPDATTLTTVEGNHICDIAQVELGLAIHQLAELFL